VKIATSPPVTPAGCSLPARGPQNPMSPGVFAATAYDTPGSRRLVSFKSIPDPLPQPRPAARRRAGVSSLALRERAIALESGDVSVLGAARLLTLIALVGVAAASALTPAIVAALIISGAFDANANFHAFVAPPSNLWAYGYGVPVLLALALVCQVSRRGETASEGHCEPT
jgi:hypothetical protein